MQNNKVSAENKSQSILVVDDDQDYRDYMKMALEEAGYKPEMVASPHAALQILEGARYALIITDLVMPAMTGFELLAIARTIDPLAVGVVMTAFGSVESALDAVRRGAYDYLFKPSSVDVIEVATRRALEHHAMRESLVRQATQLDSLQHNYKKTVHILQDVAHKLRNPLSALHGHTAYLSDLSNCRPTEVEPGKLQMSIGSIRKNATLMSNMLDELDVADLDRIT